MYDRTIRDTIEVQAHKIFNMVTPPVGAIDLVLQMPNESEFDYYLVDHVGKCLFWLEYFKVSTLASSWKVRDTLSHTQIGMLKIP